MIIRNTYLIYNFINYNTKFNVNKLKINSYSINENYNF